MSWPKTIDFSHLPVACGNARQTGDSKVEIEESFWPVTQTGENVAAELHEASTLDSADASHADTGPTGILSEAGVDCGRDCKDVGSGAIARAMRQRLIDSARRPDIDVVLVWRLDRWGRSVADLASTLQELIALRVGFVSVTEATELAMLSIQ